MKSRGILIFSFLLVSVLVLSQSRNYQKHKGYRIIERNDSISTAIYDDYIKVILNDIFVIEEYSILPNMHANWIKEGVYIKRDHQGNLIKTGQLQWNQKVGTWTHYYSTGQIKRVESYSVPFNNKHWEELNNTMLHAIGPFRDGEFIEYYENGNLKTKGNYTLVEEKRKNFTIKGIDSETYEEVPIVIKEEFWVPTSVKSKTWSEYNKEGELTQKNNFSWIDKEEIRVISQIPKNGTLSYIGINY